MARRAKIPKVALFETSNADARTLLIGLPREIIVSATARF